MVPNLDSIISIAHALEVTPSSLISEENPTSIEVKKIETQVLDSKQLLAIQQAINRAMAQHSHINPYSEGSHIPDDVLEALSEKNQDWDFIRAALDIPAPIPKKSVKNKKNKVN
jgi:hypothetical protein